jgi:phosphatidylethanolamine N-methyltransferase
MTALERRVANNLSSYNKSEYKISIVSNRADGSLRFQLGEPITVNWTAPDYHSHADWIGIYRVWSSPFLFVKMKDLIHWTVFVP